MSVAPAKRPMGRPRTISRPEDAGDIWDPDRIYTLRQRFGLTREDLAELVDVSARQVDRWERGDCGQPAKVRRRLLRIERGAISTLTTREAMTFPVTMTVDQWSRILTVLKQRYRFNPPMITGLIERMISTRATVLPIRIDIPIQSAIMLASAEMRTSGPWEPRKGI